MTLSTRNRMVNVVFRSISGLALVGGLVIAPLAASPAQAATNWHGCPQYDLCLYRHSGFVGDRGKDKPDTELYHCGVIAAISGYNGYGSIVNHQVRQSSNDGTAQGYDQQKHQFADPIPPGAIYDPANLKPIWYFKACSYT